MKAMLMLLVVALLPACVSTRLPSEASSPSLTSSTYDAMLAGFTAFQRWEQNNDASALPEAEQHLRKALEDRPDNARLQFFYYQTLYTLAARNWQQWHRQLESYFPAVNTIVKNDLTPPAFLQQLHLPDNASLAEREQLLKRAVAQQPGSVQSWYLLSVVYADQKQYWLALHAAQRAAALNPGHALMAYQLGNIYDELAYRQACIHPPSHYTHQAIRQISAAVSLEPDNEKFHDHLALVYSRVGLYPLALQEAKKAYQLKDSDWNRQTLARALLDTGDWRAAKQHYEALNINGDNRAAQEVLAVIHAMNNEWHQAWQYFSTSMDQPPDIYPLMIQRWLAAIAQTTDTLPMATPKRPADAWRGLLVDYVFDDQPVDLMSEARNDCQLTEAHFYTAMQKWMQGQTASSREHLQQVVKLGVQNYVEFQWARAMLRSNLLEQAF